jgi:hypothetical protein
LEQEEAAGILRFKRALESLESREAVPAVRDQRKLPKLQIAKKRHDRLRRKYTVGVKTEPFATDGHTDKKVSPRLQNALQFSRAQLVCVRIDRIAISAQASVLEDVKATEGCNGIRREGQRQEASLPELQAFDGSPEGPNVDVGNARERQDMRNEAVDSGPDIDVFPDGELVKPLRGPQVLKEILSGRRSTGAVFVVGRVMKLIERDSKSGIAVQAPPADRISKVRGQSLPMP